MVNVINKTKKLENIFCLKDEVSIFVKKDYNYYRLHPDKKSDDFDLTGKEALQKCGEHGELKLKTRDGKTIEGRIEWVRYHNYGCHSFHESLHPNKPSESEILVSPEEFVQYGRPFKLKRTITEIYEPIIDD